MRKADAKLQKALWTVHGSSLRLIPKAIIQWKWFKNKTTGFGQDFLETLFHRHYGEGIKERQDIEAESILCHKNKAF